jgi:hypothetical protein
MVKKTPQASPATEHQYKVPPQLFHKLINKVSNFAYHGSFDADSFANIGKQCYHCQKILLTAT